MGFDVQAVRKQFPALTEGAAHFDGPGGTQVPQCVADAVATLRSLSTPKLRPLHPDLADVSRHAINQTIGVRIWPAIFCNLVRHEPVHHFEAREIKIFRFVQHQGCDPIVETAAEISKPGMFLLDVVAVNDVEIFAL